MTWKSSALSQTICPRVPVSSVAGGNLHVLQNFSGWISKCLLHCWECPAHLTACSFIPCVSPIGPTAFPASVPGAHTATVVRGERASRQVKLSLQQFLRHGKIIPANDRTQRTSPLRRLVSGTHESLGARLKDFWTGSRPVLWSNGAGKDGLGRRKSEGTSKSRNALNQASEGQI